jgi:hypothetical protein
MHICTYTLSERKREDMIVIMGLLLGTRARWERKRKMIESE